jgi:hypothetical protein
MTSSIEKELKKDHKKIQDLSNEIEKILEGKSKGNKEVLFSQLRQELITHNGAEEQTYYKELITNEKSKDIIKEGLEEHVIITTLLEQMSIISCDSDKWKAKFAVLKEQIEHHIKEEEGKMFKQAEGIMDSVKSDEIKEDFIHKKES